MPSSQLRGVLRSWWCLAVLLLWLALLVDSSWRLPHLTRPQLICALTVTAAVSCWARVLRVAEHRLIWSMFALGASCYAGGFAVLFFVTTGEGGGPFGLNISDSISFLLYPCIYVALVLLTRSRVDRFTGSAALDGLVVSFAAWALALTYVTYEYPQLLRGDARDVLYALVYPVCGFTLFAIAVAGLVVTRRRPDGVWLLLLLAFGTWTAGDAVYAARSADGQFWFGTGLDAVYCAGPALLGLAAWVRPRLRARVDNGSAMAMSLPAVATLASLLVLVDRDPRLPDTVVRLAAGAVLLAVARTTLFVRQERLLAQRTVEARTDDLTGLANRRGLLLRLEAALAASEPSSLLRLEFDRIQQVNDALGHAAGDQLLRVLATRLGAAHPEAVVARMSGTSFALLVAGDGVGVALAEDLAGLLAAPVQVDDSDLSVAVTVGIADWDGAGEPPAPTELLRRAEVALHQAKGDGRPQRWLPAYDEDARERLLLVSDLLAALEADDQLFVHLQPKTSTRSGLVTAAEALVRWRHPRRGLVPPDGFIGAAERAGLLGAITDRVLELSLGHVVVLRDAGRPIQVAVNVAACDLLDPTFPARVHEALERHGVPARLLRIEVTETVVMSDPERIMGTLLRLRALGVGLSLDDYGTGLSSLTYLRQLPVDELKIDRSFVSQLIGDAASSLIVSSTIALAHGLGMHVVAEGVEDEQTLQALVAADCDSVQGYLLGRPGPAERLLPVPAPRGEMHVPGQEVSGSGVSGSAAPNADLVS